MVSYKMSRIWTTAFSCGASLMGRMHYSVSIGGLFIIFLFTWMQLSPKCSCPNFHLHIGPSGTGIDVIPIEIWNPESRMAIYVDADPVYDAQAPGQQPAGQGVALTAGAASFAQTPGAAQNWMPASLGGPYDLDPASYPQMNNMNYPQMSGDPTQFTSGAGGAVGLVQGSVQPSNLRSDPYFLAVGYDARPPTIHMSSVNFPKLPNWPIQLTNAASGTVINTGSADKGQLSASGKTNTNTGPMGALSSGTGSISGQGLGLTGTQVNSGQASTGTAPGPNAPSSASSNNNFVNSLQAEKGRILGNSNTVSRTGANGNAFGSSTGTASGLGEGVQLTQVANSDSQESGTGTGVMQPDFSQPWKDTRRNTWMYSRCLGMLGHSVSKVYSRVIVCSLFGVYVPCFSMNTFRLYFKCCVI